MKIVKKIYDSFTIKRKPPINIKAGDDIYFGGPSYEYTAPESYIAYISNAIVTYQGVIIENFKLVKDFIICYDSDFKFYKNKYLLHTFYRYTRKDVSDENKYMLIFDNYSGPHGFSHWLSDGLTRLVEINAILKDYTVLMPDYFAKEDIYIETIKLFDIGKVQYINQGNYLKVKHLYVAKQIADSGNFIPENVFKLRKFIWDKLTITSGKGEGEFIYVSRAKAVRRFVINEDEVVKLLKEYGFVTVYLEDYDFARQVEIAYNAKVLISIHGAALTHIHFMQSNSNVLEFRRERDSVNGHFFSLAHALNVNYYYQSCEAINISNAANNFDLMVDCNELKINLENYMKLFKR